MNAYESLRAKLEVESHTWLITGVAGFIGSNLLESLLKLNQRVVGIDNFSTGSLDNLDEVKRSVGDSKWINFHFIEGDICTLDNCYDAMEWIGLNCGSDTIQNNRYPVEYVLHHAALGSVSLSIQDPLKVNEANVNGFLNILIASRDAKVKRLVYAASSSTYGDDDTLPKIESKVGAPLSPYAVTKLVNELYANVFHRVYSLDSIGLRYFNIYGPRQDPNGAYAAVIPKWISALLHKKDVYINGDGQSTRDFCFVDDVVQANFLAATTVNTKAINQIFNIGFGENICLDRLYDIIVKHLDSIGVNISRKLIYRDFLIGDIRHSFADIKKAKIVLGFSPLMNAESGLMRVVKWYSSKL